MSKLIETRDEYVAKLNAITGAREAVIAKKVEEYRLQLEAAIPYDKEKADELTRIIETLNEVIALEAKPEVIVEEIKPVEEPVVVEEPVKEEVAVAEEVEAEKPIFREEEIKEEIPFEDGPEEDVEQSNQIIEEAVQTSAENPMSRPGMSVISTPSRS